MDDYHKKLDDARNLLAAIEQPEYLTQAVQIWESNTTDRSYFLSLICNLLSVHDSWTTRLIKDFADKLEQNAYDSGAAHPGLIVLGALKTAYDKDMTGHTFKVVFNQIFKNDAELMQQALIALHRGELDIEQFKQAMAEFKWNHPKGDEVRTDLTSKVQMAFATAITPSKIDRSADHPTMPEYIQKFDIN